MNVLTYFFSGAAVAGINHSMYEESNDALFGFPTISLKGACWIEGLVSSFLGKQRSFIE